MEGEIRNRVAENESLVVFDLEDYFPPVGVKTLDLAPLAANGIIRESEARDFISRLNPDEYADAVVAVQLDADTIIPQWIWPMAAAQLAEDALYIGAGSEADVLSQYYAQRLSRLDWSAYAHKKVLLKGCGQYPVPPSAYVQAAMHLRLSAQKLMYGEACSNVPIYRG
jgi:hypothetical protein